MTRVLVAGASGQLGGYLQQHLVRHEVLACSRAELDVSDRDAVERVMDAFAPDVVINAAAMTDVDACETRVDDAYAINALGVRWLAIAARRMGAHLVHVSTDYVFDGASPTPYREWDEPHPISVYGASKLAGEHECMQHASSWAIARTSWLFGLRGRDFVSWCINADQRGELTGLIDDQMGSPTFAGDLAHTLADMAARRTSGVYHTVNAGIATRFEQGVAALACLGRDTSYIKTMSSFALSRPAPRPAMSALVDTALQRAGLAPMRPWQNALAAYVEGM